ncbi:MAG: Ig-like domain repeat protein [Flavisolibacter sp.]
MTTFTYWAILLCSLLISSPLLAATFTVSTTADSGPGSLRQAIADAEASGGANIINVPAGVYNLTSGQISFGNVAEILTIVGADPNSTIINMTTTNQNRIFFINVSGTVGEVQVFISNIKFTNGHLTGPYGGGAILAGGPSNVLSLSNCIFDHNTIDPVTGGTTGGAINMSGGGTLTIDHCVFTNNSNPQSDGGAVNYFLQNFAGLSGSISITNSTFSNNSVTAGSGSGGGAIAIQTQGQLSGSTNTFSAAITGNTFTGNSATGTGGVGGAIKTSHGFATGNTIQIHYNRFDNNASTITPNALAMSEAAGNVDASNNWWGCNTDPATFVTSCNNAAKTGGTAGGTLTTSPWLELRASASPTSICPVATSTVTASFLTNSANTAVSVSNLTVLLGLPISFGASLGTLSGAQTTIQNTGTATVTYTAGATPGNGSVNAVVDHVPSNDPTAKAAITILTPASIQTQPSNTTVCTGSNAVYTVNALGSLPINYQWRLGSTPLQEGVKYSGVTTNTLTIHNAATADIASNYNVVVSNACANVPSDNVSLTVYDPPVVNTPDVTQPTCALPSGTIVVNATGPSGATLEYSKDGTSFQASKTFALLAPGNYTIAVRIQGLNTCVTSYSSNPVVINAIPNPPVINAPTVTQPTCQVTTGTIVVNATGDGTLEYKINDGDWGTDNSFATLAPGDYTTYVRLQSQPTCVSSSGPITINPVPVPPTVNNPTLTQPTCTVTHGKIVVNATGDGTLEYELNDLGWQVSNTFDQLAPGDYTIYVRLQSQPTCVSHYGPVIIDPIPTTPSGTPVVTGPICTGAVTVSGSSTEADGTQISVLKSGSEIATASVLSHAWSATVPALTAGDVITATALASGKCISPASTPITVSAYSSTTTSVTSSNPFSFTAAPGNTVTFTATVTGPGGAVTSGSVTFMEGTTVLSTASLDGSGQATLTTSFTTEGRHIISATFNGDCPLLGSQGSVSQQVDNHTTIAGNVFCNDQSGITINDISPATPYPSHIFVSGLSGPITGLKVRINGFTHLASRDVNVLLVGPGGQGLLILSAVGISPVANVNLVLDDAAATFMPQSVPLVSGTYKPTSYAVPIFPAPAPGGFQLSGPLGVGTLGSIFNGTNPNGTWSLYVLDNTPGNSGSIGSWCLEVTADIPPTITCPTSFSVNTDPGSCSASVSLTGTHGATATGTGPITITYKIGDNVITSPHVFTKGATTVKAIATNNAGKDSCNFVVTVVDHEPPVITGFDESTLTIWPPNHRMVAVATYSSTDNCSSSSCTVSVVSNQPDNGTGDGDTSPDWDVVGNTIRVRAERANNSEVRVYDITLTCTDADGNSTVKHKQVRVAHNITGPVTGAPFKVGSSVGFSGVFWDKPGNIHTAQWLINDGAATVKGVVTEPSGLKNGKVSGSYKFTTAGIYRLQMNITDQNKQTSFANTNEDLEEIIVIYDPNGGYTYGGGWFNSPAGALMSNPAAVGKVTYGFSVNYYKGATLPKGETQFELKVGNLQYDALNFDYLSINGYKAVFRGSGKITGGQSGINFMMYVIDGALDGTGIDKVRIKIYNKNTGQVYYDSQPGASDTADPKTPVGTNSQVVIGGNNALLTKTEVKPLLPVATLEASLDVRAIPNPTIHNFIIQVSSTDKKGPLTLQVFDQMGRLVEVRKTYSGSTVSLGEGYRPGTYFLRVGQAGLHKEIKLLKMPD